MDNPGQQQNVGESRTAHFSDGAQMAAAPGPQVPAGAPGGSLYNARFGASDAARASAPPTPGM